MEEGTFCFFDWGTSYGGCPRGDLDVFLWEEIAAYMNEMCALFGCDLEDLGYSIKIGSSLAECFRMLHEIELLKSKRRWVVTTIYKGR